MEHGVIPLDGADVFQQGDIDSIGDRVALTQYPGDFARLPVDDARQDQVQAAAGVHLLPQLAGVNPAPPPVPMPWPVLVGHLENVGLRQHKW